jgi:hypothetical protein
MHRKRRQKELGSPPSLGPASQRKLRRRENDVRQDEGRVVSYGRRSEIVAHERLILSRHNYSGLGCTFQVFSMIRGWKNNRRSEDKIY